jgi:hypothetical protein
MDREREIGEERLKERYGKKKGSVLRGNRGK